jgi:hypothetical protein
MQININMKQQQEKKTKHGPTSNNQKGEQTKLKYQRFYNKAQHKF